MLSTATRVATSSRKRTSSLFGCTLTSTLDGGSVRCSAHMGYMPTVTRSRQTLSSACESKGQRTLRPLIKKASWPRLGLGLLADANEAANAYSPLVAIHSAHFLRRLAAIDGKHGVAQFAVAKAVVDGAAVVIYRKETPGFPRIMRATTSLTKAAS